MANAYLNTMINAYFNTITRTYSNTISKEYEDKMTKFFAKNKYNKIISLYGEMISQNIQSSENIHIFVLRAYIKLNDEKNFMVELDKIISHNIISSEVYFYAISFCMELKKYDVIHNLINKWPNNMKMSACLIDVLIRYFHKIEEHHNVISLFKKYDNGQMIPSVYTTVIASYLEIQNYKNAISIFEKSKNYCNGFKQLNKSKIFINLYYKMIIIYVKINDLNKAKDLFKEFNDKYGSHMHNEIISNFSNNDLAIIKSLSSIIKLVNDKPKYIDINIDLLVK